MIYLKESTASQEVPLGFFVDSSDGNTEETGLTIANTDIKLWKTGATALANKNSGGATHISNGIYYAVLDATDTNTVGPMVIFCHVAGALAVRVECSVLPSAVYDALVAGSSNLNVAVASIANNAITAASINADAVTEIQSGLATPADIPTAAAITDAVWDEVQADHVTAGTTGKSLSNASAAGDPWSTSLPGSYASGEAGYIVGTYLDRAVSSVGFVSGGDGKGVTSKQAQDIAERVWKVKMGKKTTGEVLVSRSDFDSKKDKVMVDFPDNTSSFQNILDGITQLQNKDTGLESILAAISGIKPADYSKEFGSIKTEVASVREKMKSILPDVQKFVDAIGKFQSSMNSAASDVTQTSQKVAELQDGFGKLQDMVNKFDASLESQLDMDRRFSAMNSKMNERDLEAMRKGMEEMQQQVMSALQKFMAKMVDVKYQILQELSGK